MTGDYEPRGWADMRRSHQLPQDFLPVPRLPKDAPDLLKQDTVLVQDPSRLFVVYTVQRERHFQNLTKLYIRQLQHGCMNPGCITPTCLSCQRRISKAPVRPMTMLSAKAIAYVLIGTDEPEAALCPHLVKHRTQNAKEMKQVVPLALSEQQRQKPIKPSASQNQVAAANGVPKKGDDESQVSNRAVLLKEDHSTDKQGVIDNKNLTQSIFNTTAIDEFMAHVVQNPIWMQRVLQDAKESSVTEGVFSPENEEAERNENIASASDCPQSLSRFSCASTRAMMELLQQQSSTYAIGNIKGPSSESPNVGSEYQKFSAFIDQSLFYVFGNVEAMNNSFKSLEDTVPDTTKPHGSRRLHAGRVNESFCRLNTLKDKQLSEALWTGIWPLFAPPSDLIPAKSPILKAAFNIPQGSAMRRMASNEQSKSPTCPEESQILHAIILCCHALSAVFSKASPTAWSELRALRSRGCVGPDRGGRYPDSKIEEEIISMIDNLEENLYLRLAARLIRLIAARAHYTDITIKRSTKSEASNKLESAKETVAKGLCDYFVASQNDILSFDTKQEGRPHQKDWSMPGIMLEWARTLLLKEWDGKNEVDKHGVVGCCLKFLSILYERHKSLGLELEYFYTPAIADRFDAIESPAEWLISNPNPKTIQVMSCPFLFPPRILVTYFRALNYAKMSSMVESAMTLENLVARMTIVDPGRGLEDWKLRDHLKIALSSHFVIEIRRDNVLTDALDQLWRRERRELLRPLKVRIGTDEGEQGVDHGGVQQEFFRVATAEALSIDYGIFSTDPSTQMAWFQPCSLEPLYKYELLGLLMSLAIYNGVTLPVTFPLALYRKLLELPVNHLDDIEDGWPELTKGLRRLLTWPNGDVGDVFVRTYEISIPAIDKTIDIDMMRTKREDPWPPLQNAKLPVAKNAKETQPEAELVTNANRERFVEDYIFWLTDKSIRPQFEAFARGFFVCIDRKALKIFTPEALQRTVEGEQNIDITELEAATQYEAPYHKQHPLIKEFWSMAKGFSQTRQRQLLEFVTACDRVPVMGMSSVSFHIIRSGPDTERVPTAMTCFGRLMLPEYESGKKLRRKMRLALDNASGFGVA